MLMVNPSEVKSMKEVSEKLYIIENELRNYIGNKMQTVYGPNWFYIAPRLKLKRGPKKDFKQLNYHELERYYLQTYPDAFGSLPSPIVSALHKLPIKK